MLGRHADSGILDPEDQGDAFVVAPNFAYADEHVSGFGEFDGIGQQIDQDLAETQRVADQPRKIGGQTIVEDQFELLRLGMLLDHEQGVLQHRVQFEGRRFHSHLAGLELGEIQDVIEYPQQRPRRRVNLGDILVLLRRKARLKRQVGHAENGIHRRADFMAHVGQEYRLRFHCHLGPRPRLKQFVLDGCPLAQFRLDRRRHAVDRGGEGLHLGDSLQFPDSLPERFPSQCDRRPMQDRQWSQDLFLKITITQGKDPTAAQQQGQRGENPHLQTLRGKLVVMRRPLVDQPRQILDRQRQIGPQPEIRRLMQEPGGELGVWFGLGDEVAFLRVIQPLGCREGNLLYFLHLLGQDVDALHHGLFPTIKAEAAGLLAQRKDLAGFRLFVIQGAGDHLFPVGRRQPVGTRQASLADGEDVVVVQQEARIGCGSIGTDQSRQELDLVAQAVHQRHRRLAVLGGSAGLLEGSQRTNRDAPRQDQHTRQRERHGEKSLAKFHRPTAQYRATAEPDKQCVKRIKIPVHISLSYVK